MIELDATNYMVDLETLGVCPDPALLSIGIVHFDGKEILRERIWKISLRSCLDAGLKVDPQTLAWWMEQDPEAFFRSASNGQDLRLVLLDLVEWVGMFGKEAKIWGNGAASDNVWLASAFRAAGIKTPWGYWSDRCYRTMKNLYPEVEWEFEGVAHDPLDDAKNQARHLMKIFEIAKGVRA